jgi:hypothetical protein
MKKIYKLLVDGEIVDFDRISMDDSGNPLSELSSQRMFAYENNPTIVDISEMSMIPEVGSQHNPSTPDFPFIGDCYMAAGEVLEFARFALVVDGVVQVKVFFNLGTEYGSRLSTAFLSNPTFLEPEITE